jgi:hypothetical protein
MKGAYAETHPICISGPAHEFVESPGDCPHPHDKLHPERFDGVRTVCVACKSVVIISTFHYASSKTSEEQYVEALARLNATGEIKR